MRADDLRGGELHLVEEDYSSPTGNRSVHRFVHGYCDPAPDGCPCGHDLMLGTQFADACLSPVSLDGLGCPGKAGYDDRASSQLFAANGQENCGPWNAKGNPSTSASSECLQRMVKSQLLGAWRHEAGLRLRQACLEIHTARKLQGRILHHWNMQRRLLRFQRACAARLAKQRLSAWRTVALACSFGRWSRLARMFESWSVVLLQRKLVSAHLHARQCRIAAACLSAWHKHTQAVLVRHAC